MRTQQRPRRYVARYWLVLLKPVLRYSATRDAFVLRAVGNSAGPVLRMDRRRRRGAGSYEGAERRRVSVA
jgi:hypothetical protein